MASKRLALLAVALVLFFVLPQTQGVNAERRARRHHLQATTGPAQPQAKKAKKAKKAGAATPPKPEPVAAGADSSGSGSDMELAHEITWVDTLPPEWLMPGTAHLEHGIDIITGVERNQPVFQFTYGGVRDPYTENKKNLKVLQMPGANQVFWYPDQMEARPNEHCAFASSSSSYGTSTSYSQSLAISAGVSASFALGGAFSAEASTNRVKEGTQGNTRELFLNTAQCLTTSVTMVNLTAHSPAFLQAVAQLPTKASTDPNSDVASKFRKFFKAFGTHVYRSTDLGGELKQMTFVDKASVSSSTSSSVAAAASGGGGFAGITGSVKVSGSSSDSRSDSSSSDSSDTTITARGGQPGSFSSASGAALSWGPWAKTIPMQPVPVNFKLMPLHKLPLFSGKAKAGQREAVQTAMRQYLRYYAQPGAGVYQVIALFENDCLDTKCTKKVPAPTTATAASATPRFKQQQQRRLRTFRNTPRWLYNRRRAAQEPSLIESGADVAAGGEWEPKALTNPKQFPLLSIHGSRASIRSWLLGSDEQNPFPYGKTVKMERETPDLGDITGISLEMAYGSFRYFRVVSLATGTTYVFDTRASKGTPSDKNGGTGLEWNLKPLLIEKRKAGKYDNKYAGFVPGEFDTTLKAMYANSQNRYEIVMETTDSHRIASGSDVMVTVTGSSGSFTTALPSYTEKYWGMVGKRAALQQRINSGTASPDELTVDHHNNSVFRTYSDGDGDGAHRAFFSYETDDIGAPEHVSVSLRAADDSAQSTIALAPFSTQREVALKICEALLDVQGPQTDICGFIEKPNAQRKKQSPTLQELGSVTGYSGIDLSTCETVKSLMAEGGSRYSCQWDKSKKVWKKYKPGSTTDVIAPSCGKWGCKVGDGCGVFSFRSTHQNDCLDLIPSEGERLFSPSSALKDSLLSLTVRKIWVTSYRHAKTLETDINSQVTSLQAKGGDLL